MSNITNETIEQALRGIEDVLGGGADIVDRNRVERIALNGGSVALTLNLPTDDPALKQRVEDTARAAIKAVDGVTDVMIMTKGAKPSLGSAGPAQPQGRPAMPGQSGNPFDGQAPIEGVKNIIAVSSAKGGVGKSTVCVNLALALSKLGAKVGLLDADVYGPSLQVLLGVTERPTGGTHKEIAPIEKNGLRMMSLAFITEQGQPVIWRGPIVMGVVTKFLREVEWGELDYLLVDMPPGTGDTQLTLVQTVPLTGAIIVTTPSELALVDAVKGLQMYRSVDAPVLGIVENMSYFACAHCGDRTDIFGRGGGQIVAEKLGTEFLGELPLDPHVRAAGDEGEPIVARDFDSPVSRTFVEIAERVREICPAPAT